MTPGTDFSGHKNALVLSLTKGESVIYPNSQEGEKKYSFCIYLCNCSAFTRIFKEASLFQNVHIWLKYAKNRREFNISDKFGLAKVLTN